MNNIVKDKIGEWTNGDSVADDRISVFVHIRDIPYAIVPELFDVEKGPGRMLNLNKGFCVPKHFLMGMIYEELKMPVKYDVYSFKWSSLEVGYPEHIRRFAEKMPVTYHLALKIFTDNKWIVVDATWDPGLQKTGFPVNDTWDGISDTKLAVTGACEFSCDDIYECAERYGEKIDSDTMADKLAFARFSSGFNEWISSIRDIGRNASCT